MHALKDYYGMVRILEEFPQVRQTFNLVPSMMVQVEEYAAGTAARSVPATGAQARREPHGRRARIPAATLFLLRPAAHDLSLSALRRDVRRVAARRRMRGRGSLFGAQEIRDLQMWSQLAWFDEEFQEARSGGPRLGRARPQFHPRRPAPHGREAAGDRRQGAAGIPDAWPRRGRSRSPPRRITIRFCRCCAIPISRGVSHPGVPLPPRFRYPQDARRSCHWRASMSQQNFGVAPVGLWPSEGSVSDEVFAIAADLGFQWAATDNGVLNRTLGRGGAEWTASIGPTSGGRAAATSGCSSATTS